MNKHSTNGHLTVAIDLSILGIEKQRTGIGRYAFELSKALLRQKDGVSYKFYTRAPVPDELVNELRQIDGHVTVRTVPSLYLRAWRRTRFPPLEWWLGQADVVHVPGYYVPPMARSRVVYTIHDLGFLRYPEFWEPYYREIFTRDFRQGAALASKIAADSTATEQDIVEFLREPKEKIHIVPLAVDDRYKPSPAEAARRFLGRFLPFDEPYALTIGTLEPRRNYARLIEAFVRATDKARLPHKLLIVGNEGYQSMTIYETAKRLGVFGERVIFMGYQDKMLPSLMCAADAYLYPSLLEGFGISVAEALACGKPIMTSNISALPEVVGDAALAVDPFDVDSMVEAIVRILCDEDLRLDLAERAVRRAQRFTYERVARDMRALYAMAAHE